MEESEFESGLTMPRRSRSNLSRVSSKARARRLALKLESEEAAQKRREKQAARQAALRARETPEETIERRRKQALRQAASRARSALARHQQFLVDSEKAKALLSNTVTPPRKWRTLEEKLKIIEQHAAGKSYSAIAEEHKMSISSVQSILRKKDMYKALGTYTSLHQVKYFARTSPLMQKVEEQLLLWLENQTKKKIPLTPADIKRKALALFNELQPESDPNKFSLSRGWYHGFRNRVNLQNYITRMKLEYCDTPADAKFRSDFEKIVEHGGYTRHQIFNVEKTSLSWRKMTSQNLLPEWEQRRQEYEESLILLLGGNAAGDLKLKPMIVTGSDTTPAPTDSQEHTPPVIWRSNKITWLTKVLLKEWFTDYFCPTVETYCRDRGLPFKILLLLDRAPNGIENVNENVTVVYRPHNMPSLLQPCVFPILKAKYLKEMFLQAISVPEKSLLEFWFGYTIQNAIDVILKCWHDTSPDDLAASWHNLLPDGKVTDFHSQLAPVIQDVVGMGQCIGFITIDRQQVQDCIGASVQELHFPERQEDTTEEMPFEQVTFREGTPDMSEEGFSGEVTPDIFEGLHFKEEAPDTLEEIHFKEEQDAQPHTDEIQKIIHNIEAACEAIATHDPDMGRSIKVRQILLDGIQPYRDLYLERQKNIKSETTNDF